MRTKKLIIPPINVIAKFIGVPDLMDWKGNCYGIASKIVNDEVIDDNCRAIYGHYLGPISRTSMFKDRIGMPFVPHGWIELSNGDIIDPTRWVFEDEKPYIAKIDKDDVAEEYDEGGNGWRANWQDPAPQYDKTERCFPIVLKDEACSEYLMDLLIDERKENIKEVSLGQMFWIANLSLLTLGLFAKDIFTWIDNMGLKALIPMDNQIKILSS